MNSSLTSLPTIFLVFQILLCLVVSHTNAQPPFVSRVCQDQFGNYTANSTFKGNLDNLLSTITSNIQIDYGFYNFSVGNNMDRVNGIALCRPDLSVADCQSCLKDAAAKIISECPNQKDVIGWYDNCTMRYSPRYIFGKEELGPWYHLDAKFYAINKKGFNQTASTLLRNLQKNASLSRDSRYKFAADLATVDDSRTIYALVQCTPDLEAYDCYECLDSAIDFSLTNVYGKQARVFYTSCNIRYESYEFYNMTRLLELQQQSPLPPYVPVSPPSNTTTKGRRSKKFKKLIILLPIFTSVALLSILLIYWHFTRARRAKALKNVEIGYEIRTPESLQMDFATVKAATNNFSDSNKLGRGGFGTVYKGRLSNGQAIAVKRLSQNAGQGEEEFKNEAVLVARLQHKNLVRFLGFSLEEQERLLIYEFVPNRSLDCFLFDPIKRMDLDWQTRYKIIGGIARGLLYLHEDSRLLVVHRDLKPANILLDAEMNAKIADFGMAKLFSADETHGNASKICGTYGYMPPEYVQRGLFSIKSDVFSFGILLLEIISGIRISNFENTEAGDNLLNFAWKNWLEGTKLNIVDSIMTTVNTEEVLRCINIGLLCVQENIAHRPIMSSVVLMLNSTAVALPVPSRPAFLLSDKVASDLFNTVSNQATDDSNHVSISEFEPR